MCLKGRPRFKTTVVFRLTLWYTCIFSLASFVIFFVLYLVLVSDTYKRTDQDLGDQCELFGMIFRSKGLPALKTEMLLESVAIGTSTTFFRVLAPDGTQLASSDMSKWGDVSINREACVHALSSEPVFETVVPTQNAPKARVAYSRLGSRELIQAGKSLAADEHLVRRYLTMSIERMVIVTILATIVGWLMARRAMSGVQEVTKTARVTSAGLLDKRVPISGRDDEIDRLATAFNAMLDRISVLIESMKQITDNIAHELRTPIARMRGVAEVALMHEGPDTEFEAALASTIEECDRLLAMINTMLDISETEAGIVRPHLSRLNICTLVRHVGEFAKPVADDKGVRLTIDAPDEVSVMADKKKLRRALLNVVGNALKYTPAGGSIAVAIAEDNATVVLSVTDTGVGISQDDLPHIFDRFYRGDQSRSEVGSGLGLSLSRAIVRAHGGDIAATSSLGVGTTVRIVLPRAEAASNV